MRKVKFSEVRDTYRRHPDFDLTTDKNIPMLDFQLLSMKHGFTNPLSNCNSRTLKVCLLLGISSNTSDGYDALDMKGHPHEIKTADAREEGGGGVSFKIIHRLDERALIKARKPEWVFATFNRFDEMLSCYVMHPSHLETTLLYWETRLDEWRGKSVAVSLSLVEKHGIQVFPVEGVDFLPESYRNSCKEIISDDVFGIGE